MHKTLPFSNNELFIFIAIIRRALRAYFAWKKLKVDYSKNQTLTWLVEWKFSERIYVKTLFEFSVIGFIKYCLFIKAKQLYWNGTSAWVFSCKFVAYFENTFSNTSGWLLLKIQFNILKIFTKIFGENISHFNVSHYSLWRLAIQNQQN